MSYTFGIITLGCAKNEVDSDRMRTLLLDAGLTESDQVEECDVMLVNTCSFLEVATQKSIETILDVASAKMGTDAKCPIIVCGCMPSRYGEESLKELIPEVAAYVGVDEEDNIVEHVSKVLGTQLAMKEHVGKSFLRTIEGSSAYVKISDGCDRFCSFCAIPYIRGRYKSRDAQEILDEVSGLLEGGVKEIVLIGQDTGVWGCDFEDDKNLAWLLKEVARLARPYDAWVRVLYLQPEGMTDELISTIRDTPEILNYIDMPIQHCNADILKAMRREGSTEQYRELFARLRKEIPGMILRTTGLCGFPGETDEQFDELLEFVEEQEFDYCSVFSYSAEENTAAYHMKDQVPEDIKLEREQALLDAAEASGFSATASHVGEICDVIIDGIEETDDGVEFIGHTWFQAPDCDGAVHIEEGEFTIGDKVTCELTDAFCYELIGVPVSK